ncbi:MAG TPA: hypothetical protein VGV57_13810 [Thermoleophilaceae bacterium]|nr:hypothetical protein [Thermoleophilaceae bacterium]
MAPCLGAHAGERLARLADRYELFGRPDGRSGPRVPTGPARVTGLLGWADAVSGKEGG